MSEQAVTVIQIETGGVEIQWSDDSDTLRGYIVVSHDGEARFPHGDGFTLVMAGDETRVEHDDGTVLWHCRDLPGEEG